MKYLFKIHTSLLLLLLLVSLRVSDPILVEQTRLNTFDNYQRSDIPVQSDDLVLLNIGEKALARNGQWPWPRSYFAQLIQDLRSSNAGLIVMTIMFPEQDRFGQDQTFADYLDGNGVVLSQVPTTKSLFTKAPFVGTIVLGDGDPYNFAYTYPNLVKNIDLLESKAWGAGLINAAPEIDGVTRRIPMISIVDNQLYPSLVMETMRANSNTKGYTLKVEETGIENVRIVPYDPVVTDHTGSVWIMWNKKFDQIEYGERTMHGHSPISDLGGKTVIVGVTAEGIVPMSPSPFGLKYPHEIQASLFQTVLSGESISRPFWSDFVEISVMVGLGLVVILSVFYLPIVWSMILSLVSIFGVVIGSFYMYQQSLVLLDWSFPLITLIIVFAQSSFSNFYVQFKLRQQIKKQFETYLDPRQVELLQKNPELLRLGGERKNMTYLFMDIVGFTPISEYYKNNDDPEGLVELINDYLNQMTNIILSNGGTIDKYMGDCIMAFWNAPLPCDNHAEMAVRSAIQIEEKTNELRQQYKEMGLPDINVGTGINTGDGIVGNMGSESRFDYSVIGDAVNLAARLEATAARHEYVNNKTIYSSYTKEQLPDSIESEKIGEINVKGKKEKITIYSPKQLQVSQQED